MIWENGIETYIISCVKWVASPGSMHDAGCLGLVRWDDPGGWCGEVGGGGLGMGSTCVPVVDSFWCVAEPIQYCKVKKQTNKHDLVRKLLCHVMPQALLNYVRRFYIFIFSAL